MSNHIIIGAGEIGTSIEKLMRGSCDVEIRDITSSIIGNFKYMHIAFPCIGRDIFIQNVKKYQERYNPEYIIIHSTVPPGTIRELGSKAVYVPIRGKHPNLAIDIANSYPLYVCGNDNEAIKHVAALFEPFISMGVVPLTNHPPETMEIAKIMSTTYYGWNIIFEKIVRDICNEYNIDFNVVYRDYNTDYNNGMIKRETPHFCRPVLEHMKGEIGGHCVMQNMSMFLANENKHYKSIGYITYIQLLAKMLENVE